MKNTMLAMLLLAMGGFTMAQDHHRTAPESVKQSFHRDFPDANNATWSRSNNQWNAKFDDRSSEDRGEMVAHYDQNGRHIDSHIPYASQDVPAPVYTSARKRYRSHNNLNFTRIENPAQGDFFQVHVNIGGKTRTSYYDEQGHERQYHSRY